MKRFVVLLVGIIFIVIGAFLYFKTINLEKNCTEEVEAIVVDMKEEIDTDAESGSNFIYYPIIEYKVKNDIVRVTMSSGSNIPEYNIDDKITILYNPSNTEEYIVKGDHSSNIFSALFIFLGVFVTGYGIFVALKREEN